MAELTIFGALQNAMTQQKQLTPIPSNRGGWRRIAEPFAGAWQMNVEEKHGTMLCYPTLYACLRMISQDIGTMPFVLQKMQTDDIWITVENSAYSPVLRKPNSYQTDQQFREAWVLSLLIHGNTYVLKRRDNRGVVIDMYVLDPDRVQVMVSEMGSVFYQINYPNAQNLLPESYPAEQLTVPASEIIHHRINCFHHQLVGIPPVCAAYWPTIKNLKILKSSSQFFGNNAQPGGILSVPAATSEEDAEKFKQFWNTNFTGDNAGKVAVIGADVKFVSMGMAEGADSQIVGQLEYSDRQICQPFGVPPFMAGIGEIPAGMKTDEITTTYYQRALRPIIEGMERLLDEGLGVSRPLGISLDEEPLLRMDLGKQAEVETKLVGGKIKTPDEARKRFNLSSTGGGGTLWGQNQDYPLGMLADRAEWDPQMIQNAPAPAAPENDDPPPDDEADEQIERGLRAITALNTIKAIEAARNEAFNERI